MPTYDYKCNKCNKKFEHFAKMSDADLEEVPESVECPEKAEGRECSSEAPSKCFSASGNFHLKGGGWYKDGY